MYFKYIQHIKKTIYTFTAYILDKINNLNKNLKNDKDIDELIFLHSNKEIENIFKKVLKNNSSEEIKELAEDYINLIGKKKLNSSRGGGGKPRISRRWPGCLSGKLHRS